MDAVCKHPRSKDKRKHVISLVSQKFVSLVSQNLLSEACLLVESNPRSSVECFRYVCQNYNETVFNHLIGIPNVQNVLKTPQSHVKIDVLCKIIQDKNYTVMKQLLLYDDEILDVIDSTTFNSKKIIKHPIRIKYFVPKQYDSHPYIEFAIDNNDVQMVQLIFDHYIYAWGEFVFTYTYVYYIKTAICMKYYDMVLMLLSYEDNYYQN